MAHMLFKKKFDGLQKDDNNQSQAGEVSPSNFNTSVQSGPGSTDQNHFPVTKIFGKLTSGSMPNLHQFNPINYFLNCDGLRVSMKY